MTLMINKLIDGKSIALNIREELKLKINQLKGMVSLPDWE